MTQKESPIVKVLRIIAGVLFASIVVLVAYTVGYAQGSVGTHKRLNTVFSDLLSENKRLASVAVEQPAPTLPPAAAPTPTPTRESAPVGYFSGPQLWEVVNRRRMANGVSGLGTRDEICTIASLRLNELLTLGSLDGHEGFHSLPERREELKWIYDTYNLSEFLLSGAQTAEEAADLWQNTLGHSKLITGGEYVWGCIYAQNGFAVAIAAF